jgi:hypothetical protein
MVECFPAHGHPSDQTLVLEFDVSPSGAVVISSASGGLSDAPVGRCIRRQVSRVAWRAMFSGTRELGLLLEGLHIRLVLG